jgi:pimeloyl-ACP methyl ester carboxylesterase
MSKPVGQPDMLQGLAMIGIKESVDHFSMFGFSMGGRIVLSLLPKLHPRVEQVFLAAPDGIKTQKVFDVAVYPAWGRWLFRMVSKKPELFFFLLRILRQWGRISKFMYEFTTNHMDTREKRDRIYYTWVTLKNFTPDVAALKNWLNEKQLPVHLFFGETDEVITPSVGRYFQEDLPHCTLDVIPKGHKLIDPVLVPYLKPYL